MKKINSRAERKFEHEQRRKAERKLMKQLGMNSSEWKTHKEKIAQEVKKREVKQKEASRLRKEKLVKQKVVKGE